MGPAVDRENLGVSRSGGSSCGLISFHVLEDRSGFFVGGFSEIVFRHPLVEVTGVGILFPVLDHFAHSLDLAVDEFEFSGEDCF